MRNGRVRAFAAALCMLMPVAAVSASDLVPVNAFAHRGGYSMPRLSPDGKYLAVAAEAGDDHAVMIYRVDDMSHLKSLLRLPKYEIAKDIKWVGPEHLIVELATFQGTLDQPIYIGEIIATDVDGKHVAPMFSHKQGLESRGGDVRHRDDGYAVSIGHTPKANDHFYMQTYTWGSEEDTSLYDVDAINGSRRLIGQIGVGTMTFTVDPDGNVRYASGLNEANKYVLYRMQGSQWSQLTPDTNDSIFIPIGFSQDKQYLYAFSRTNGGPESLIQMNADGSHAQLLAKDDFGSVDLIQWTPQDEPFAVASASGIPHATILDTNAPTAQLYQTLSKQFPNEFLYFISFSEDGNALIFSTSSDRDPGTYYLFDRKAMKVQRLFQVNSAIDPAKMGKRVPMRFTASDGMPLEAILTVPAGAPMNNLPMVLLPHGGPFGPRDTWHFDNLAQFVASRGYLVLQVNYRGSGGRGLAFEHAGYRQWGTRIQQDLIDGVKWAESQQYADPKRVCVFGGSFGGYSAMMTTIRAPGLFKCAIGYSGIYDLAMMYGKGDIKQSTFGKNYLEQAIGKEPTELAANSPDKLADKIDVPVLLIHGEEDQRAPFAQAKAMRAALDAAHKPYEWLVKSGEGHGFYKEENLVDMYNHVQAFLEKNIGPGARSPSSP